MPILLSADEAARRLSISLRTLARLKKTKSLPYVALSARRHLYREVDIVEFLETRLVK